jgi:hypothetical protein
MELINWSNILMSERPKRNLKKISRYGNQVEYVETPSIQESIIQTRRQRK